MRVAVNLLWLAPGRVGGSEEYLARQLAGLPPDAGIEPVLYCQPTLAAAHPELARRFELVAMPFRRDWRGARVLAEHTWLPARTGGADLVHHGGGTVPLVTRRPVVLTVHDIQYASAPERFSAVRLRYLRWMMPRSIRRATVVATPSHYVRASVIDVLGAADHAVVVVPHGVPDPEPRPGDDEIVAAREAYDLGDRPYVVYPAITHPHKAHRVLVDMLAHADPDLLLVLPGGEGAAETSLRQAIAASGDAARIRRPGRIPRAELDALLAGAEALVFPSEYEGFGAPLVEAMTLGTPIVCSTHPAIREVVGDAAVVVESASGEAWADAVAAARRRRAELVVAGTARRAAFTPEVSGAALAAAYRRAGERP